jgi:hypothetical protein
MADGRKPSQSTFIGYTIDVGELLLVLFFDLPRQSMPLHVAEQSREVAPYMLSERDYIRVAGY